MLAKKNSLLSAILLVALALVLAGCTPAGPRALLKGKKYLDRGEYADAVDQLKTATSLLATNAAAWNYYGVALQGAGHLDEAATAYQTALKFDRDLVEAHFNLGSVWLEQGRTDVARAEFTAYTLHRPNDPAGWLKLGSTQLRAGDPNSAERSFSAVYHIDANNPEAFNGLGLARVQGGKPQDAAKFFAAAVKLRPDYAAAILNLATVNQQYLHDDKAALDSYHDYLALKVRPGNWAEVNALAASLEAAQAKAAPVPLPPIAAPPSAPVIAETKPPAHISNVVTQRSTVMVKPQPVAKAAAQTPIRPIPVQVVEVKPETVIVATPPPTTPPKSEPPAVAMAQQPQETTQPPADQPGSDTPNPDGTPKKGFWGKIFHGGGDNNSKYLGDGLTPLPSSTSPDNEPKPVVVPAAKPLETVTPVPVFAHYNYFSPRKPAPGDRKAANGSFTRARLFEQDENWPDALAWYQEAAVLDPSWFEAQYNTGVLAHRLRNFSVALPRYEMALAVQPSSVDARYNFALALKAAGYVPDAAEQLKIILAESPKEVRAHLALANIYAQSLRDTAQAREHYQAVLDLDPTNPQTSDIHFWLSANPR